MAAFTFMLGYAILLSRNSSPIRRTCLLKRPAVGHVKFNNNRLRRKITMHKVLNICLILK